MFFDHKGAPIRVGGDVAAYRPVIEDIVMPPHERFEDGELWYAPLVHEVAHLSGSRGRARSRRRQTLSRESGLPRRGGTNAKLAAAMMGAHLGFAGDHIDDHARYIGGWIKALCSDKPLLLKAAAEAQRTVDWMLKAAGITNMSTSVRDAT